MPDLALSTWSLHRALGPMYPGLDLDKPSRLADDRYGKGTIMLEDVPAIAAGLGLQAVEICHFHLARTDQAYLDDIRTRLDAAGVRLLTLLVDEGDITAPDADRRRLDRERIRAWIDIAATLGAERARVVAGESAPGAEAVRWSADALRELADYGRTRSVRVVTENWRPLSLDVHALTAILDGADGTVGLCADFGNWSAPRKYDDLRVILPRASSIHAKAEFSAPGAMDEADFGRCLDLARAADFAGSYVLIFDGPGDEAASLRRMAQFIQPYL